MGEFHRMSIRIADDAQVPGIRVQKRGAELQQAVLLGLFGHSIHLLAGRQSKAQMADRPQWLLRSGARYTSGRPLLQHQYKSQLIVGPVAQPDDMHAGA